MKLAIVLSGAAALFIWAAEPSFAGAGPSAASPGVGDRLFISVTNKFGDVFTNLTIAKILGDGLLLQHESGQFKVKFAELPTTVRRKYQPLAIAAVEKENGQAAANAAYVAREKQVVQQQSREQSERTTRSERESSKNMAIEIPGQGWSIVTFNAGQVETGRQSSDRQFVYEATSKQGFNISIWVEAPEGPGMRHEDVFNYYWPKASRNPLIDPRTVKVEKSSDKFVKVSYLTMSIQNANYYFAYKGKWVDVHVSQTPLRSGDEKAILAEFDQALSYGK
jgi:hypothetical protein